MDSKHMKLSGYCLTWWFMSKSVLKKLEVSQRTTCTLNVMMHIVQTVRSCLRWTAVRQREIICAKRRSTVQRGMRETASFSVIQILHNSIRPYLRRVGYKPLSFSLSSRVRESGLGIWVECGVDRGAGRRAAPRRTGQPRLRKVERDRERDR